MRRNPCKNCEDRVPGCHGTCEHYIAWKAAREEEKEISRHNSKGERDAKSFEIAHHLNKQRQWRKFK